MKQVSYHETETLYAAGSTIDEARKSLEDYGADNPLDAWEALEYFERTTNPHLYEVFRFTTTTEVTNVDPPYSRS